MPSRPPHQKSAALLTVLIGVWLVIAGSLTAFIVALDFRNAEQRFQEHSTLLYEHAVNVAQNNEAVLEGYAALLGVMGTIERPKVAQYATEMRSRYPHIYAFEAVRRVPRERLNAFVAEERSGGFPDFSLKAFAPGASPPWRGIDDKPEYYPVVLMEPLRPEARAVLGLDIDSVAVLHAALNNVQRLHTIVATEPFLLAEGGLAYGLFAPVAGHGDDLYATLVVKTDTMLPAEVPGTDRLRVSIYQAAFTPDDPRGQLASMSPQPRSALERVLFPRLTFMRTMTGPAHPFTVTVVKQLGWADLSKGLLAGNFTVSLLTFALLLAYGRSHHLNEIERLRAEDRLFYLANYDSLTALPNRSLFLDRLQHAHSQAQRHGTALSLLFLDVDEFKSVNDTYGHAVGDELLKLFAERLRTCVRVDDSIGRLGGDEFVIVLENVGGPHDAQAVADKIQQSMTRPFGIAGHELKVHVSVGIANYPEHARDIQELLRLADREMYANKAHRAAQRRGATADNTANA